MSSKKSKDREDKKSLEDRKSDQDKDREKDKKHKEPVKGEKKEKPRPEKKEKDKPKPSKSNPMLGSSSVKTPGIAKSASAPVMSKRDPKPGEDELFDFLCDPTLDNDDGPKLKFKSRAPVTEGPQVKRSGSDKNGSISRHSSSRSFS